MTQVNKKNYSKSSNERDKKNPTIALILLFNHSARQEKTNNSILINQMAKINLKHQS